MEVSHNAHLFYYLPFPSQVYLRHGISNLVDGVEASHNAHLYFYLPFPSQVYLSHGISNPGVSMIEWKSATTLLTISKPGISKSWHLKPWGLIDRMEISHNAHLPFPSKVYLSHGISNLGVSLIEWKSATTLLTISKPGISTSWHLKPWGLIDRMEVSHNAHLYYYLPFPSQVYLSHGISNLGVSLIEWRSATTLLTISKPGISKSWHLKPKSLIDRVEVSHNATYHFQARYI